MKQVIQFLDKPILVLTELTIISHTVEEFKN